MVHAAGSSDAPGDLHVHEVPRFDVGAGRVGGDGEHAAKVFELLDKVEGDGCAPVRERKRTWCVGVSVRVSQHLHFGFVEVDGQGQVLTNGRQLREHVRKGPCV